MRKITVRNARHPLNMVRAEGQRVKEMIRKMSNDELDFLIADRMSDDEAKVDVLSWSRTRKIRVICEQSMSNFARLLAEEIEKHNSRKDKDEHTTQM